MRVLVVYNRYRHHVHGEEFVVNETTRLLRRAGIDVSTFIRSSQHLPRARLGKLAAGLAGIYNPVTQRQLAAQIRRERPDVVHAHNLYPWISPSAVVAARRARVPLVMTVHHYGLTCPVLTHFRAGKPCDDCVTEGEWTCIRHNCRNSLFESTAYALRAYVARHRRWFLDGVAIFIALSAFAKEQLQRAGFPADRIVVRPNVVAVDTPELVRGVGKYVAYAGRLSYEKGVDLLCRAAAQTGLPLHIAGETSQWPRLAADYSAVVRFRGVLSGDELGAFYREARFLVVPSRWWEVCPIVVLEAMSHGCPVLAAASAGLPELVDSGRAGVLFEPGSVESLAREMRSLWLDEPLLLRLSAAGRERVAKHYAPPDYLADLLRIYQRAQAA